ncbi:MAG TPA: VOC family protein [Acidimicrobiales bacterium]|nr:VOC family protein [Acidimicrobiales bacterium]
MPKITPFLWFDTQAKEAADFYCDVFGGKVGEVTYYSEAGPGPKGSVLTVRFDLGDFEVVALNGGPAHYNFSEAFSLAVACKSQEEVDYFWGRLNEGGEEGQCGWLKDRYGLSWQIVPSALPELLSRGDPATTERVMRAMFQMKKLELAVLEKAASQP